MQWWISKTLYECIISILLFLYEKGIDEWYIMDLEFENKGHSVYCISPTHFTHPSLI